MFFALIWLRQSRAGKLRASSLALACSILIKYTTAPLLVAHLLYIAFRLKPSWRVALRDSAPAIGGLLIVALWFVWSKSYHNGAASMVEWKFLGLSDFVRGAAHLVGVDLQHHGQIEALISAMFVLVAGWSCWSFAKAPTDGNFGKAIVSIACLTTFVLVGHVWPWFIIWCLVFVALVPDFWLSWFVVGVAAVAPFSIVHWWRMPDDGFQHSQLPALLMYGTGLVMVAIYFMVVGGPACGIHSANQLTANDEGEAPQVGPLLGQIPGPIASVTADGA
jgi:alpha-1,6-mannosyltransferase